MLFKSSSTKCFKQTLQFFVAVQSFQGMVKIHFFFKASFEGKLDKGTFSSFVIDLQPLLQPGMQLVFTIIKSVPTYII